MSENEKKTVENTSQLMRFNLVTRMGSDMLVNGGEIFRTETAMRYAAEALKLESFNAYVIANGIFASAVADEKIHTCRICYLPLEPIKLCRVEALNNLSRRVAAGNCSLTEMERELVQIEKLEASGNLMKIIASGCGSGSFCYLLQGSVSDCLCAFAAGVLLYIFLLYCVPLISIPKIMSNIMASALSALICCALYSLGAGSQLDRMIIGAIFPLVPGIALTNAIRNFLENDYLSGLIRLADALITAGGIAIGVGTAMRLWSMTGGIL